MSNYDIFKQKYIFKARTYHKSLQLFFVCTIRRNTQSMKNEREKANKYQFDVVCNLFLL